MHLRRVEDPDGLEHLAHDHVPELRIRTRVPFEVRVHRRRQNERVNRVVAEDLAVRPGILRIGEAGIELLRR